VTLISLKSCEDRGELPASLGENPEDAAAAAELYSLVRKAVAHLPHDERQIVERYYFGEKTIESSAEEVGIERTSASRLHMKAIATLGRTLRHVMKKTNPGKSA